MILPYVDMVVPITSVSLAMSNTGGGVGKCPGFKECSTNARLMQALLYVVE